MNLTLKDRLHRDFRLVLPDLGEEGTPERYFAEIEAAIRERRRVRRFVTVGLFPFSRLVTYHDLDPDRWPEHKALHLDPVLVDLLGESDRCKLMVGSHVFAGQVAELTTLAQHYRELARLTEGRLATATGLFQASGMCLALTAHNLATMLDAIDLLRSTPRKRLLLRSPTLRDEAMRLVLERAVEEARAINERRTQLLAIFSFSQDDSPQEYRGFAAALRRTGFFDRFLIRSVVLSWLADDEFKRALCARHGARKHRTKASHEGMAREIERLAQSPALARPALES